MVNASFFVRRLQLVGITILALFALAPAAFAQTVTLAWNANDESDLDGYIVQYGTQSGNPSTNVDVGNVTSRQFTGLQVGLTYYFRVVAYNDSDMQSAPSAQVAFTVPVPPPPPPPAPSLVSVSPGSGPAAGGTAITLSGGNFVAGATVRVGGTAATGVSVLSASQIQATTPAGTPGSRSVQVVNPDGQSATLNNAFSYVASAPTLSSVSPSGGGTDGGTQITLTGANFVSGATVRVGGVAATGVSFQSATQLRATTPAGTAGPKAVQVTNPDGQSATLNNAFTYSASAPVLTSVTPSSGPTDGGTEITLTGDSFVSGATVRVGGVSATGVVFVNENLLRATTPAGSIGAKSVQVVNPDGQSVTLANAFSHVSTVPTLTAVSPNSGPTAGGTLVTITGTNFVSGATVRIGGVAATGVSFQSATQLRATTPAGTAGAKTVQVTNPNAESASLSNAFTYSNSAPTLTSLSPTSGPTDGGTQITLTGANFISGATVRIGGVAATNVSFQSAIQLRATTPAGAAGAKSVQVTNPDGQSVTLANAFTHVSNDPILTAVSPNSGPTAGGTQITITGANFVSGATVRVGGVAATGVSFQSATQLRATTPAGTAGAKTVQVTNPNAESASLSNAFTYSNSAPTLTSLSPTSGPTDGGTQITLTGANFISGATVRIGGVAATSVSFQSATQLRATTPAGTAGAKSVQVTNPDSQSVTLANAFTYTTETMSLTEVSPSAGPTAGGTVITLTGANFAAGLTVRVGTTAATNVTVISPTQARATTPACAPGAVAVQVTKLGGQSATRANAFTYTQSSNDDSDGDGLPTAWEQQFGLNANSATGVDGAAGDPDADSSPNLQEYQAGSHPRGGFHKYLAEGATNEFFATRLSIANPQAVEAKVLLSFGDSNGRTTRRFLVVPPRSRRSVEASQVAELAGTSFATSLESDQLVVLDRLMTWAYNNSWAAHTETAVERPATTWYFAEGATGGPFELFYLVLNPNPTAAELQIRYLRPNGKAPLVKTYTVDPGARYSIWVDMEHRELANTDVSAEIISTNGVPVIVERSMYLTTWRRTFKGGHNSAGVTAPATNWFLAEGSTGDYFSMFVLFANPTGQTANVRATYMRSSGAPIVKTYTVQPNSRYTVDVSTQDRELRDASVAVQVESTNGVPIIVERTMWWPNTWAAGGWTEGHNAFGTTTTGPRWLLAEGEVGGRRAIETFVLVANTSAAAANVKVTVLFESGAEASKTYTIAASRRFTVPLSSDFAGVRDKRFSVLVESLNPAQAGALVVERAMYWNTDDEIWGAGSNAIATKLP